MAPLILKLDTRELSSQLHTLAALYLGKNPGIHWIEKGLLLCQNLNPGSSSPYPGHYADYATPYI